MFYAFLYHAPSGIVRTVCVESVTDTDPLKEDGQIVGNPTLSIK